VAVERIQRDIRVETENRKLVELRRENLVKEAQAQAEAAAAQQRKIFEAIKEFAGGKAPEVYAAMAEVEKAKALSDKIQTAFLTPEQMMLKMKMPSANGKSD
jgi:aminopeptidase N